MIDALRPRRASTYIDMPLTPMRVWEAIAGRGGAGMIPAEFDYAAPDVARRGASPRSREGGEDAKLLAGGHSLHPADEAAPRGADAARRPAPRAGPARRRSATTATFAIGAMTPHADARRTRADLGLLVARRRRRSPTRRCATAGRSAARSPTATRRPTCRRSLLALEGSVALRGRRRRRATIAAGRPVRRTT